MHWLLWSPGSYATTRHWLMPHQKAVADAHCVLCHYAQRDLYPCSCLSLTWSDRGGSVIEALFIWFRLRCEFALGTPILTKLPAVGRQRLLPFACKAVTLPRHLTRLPNMLPELQLMVQGGFCGCKHGLLCYAAVDTSSIHACIYCRGFHVVKICIGRCMSDVST
jgi:hypothetical protein